MTDLRRPPLIARFVYEVAAPPVDNETIVVTGPWTAEIAWRVPESGKVVRHTLQGSDLRAATPIALPGGSFFGDGKVLHFLSSDGSARNAPFPSSASVVRIDDAFLSLDALGQRVLTWDGTAAPPRVVHWNLGRPDGLVGGPRPFAHFTVKDFWAVVPLTPFGLDPPEPHLVRPREAMLPRCAEADRGLLVREPPSPNSSVRVEIAGNPLPRIFSSVGRLVLVRSDGTSCLRGFERDELLLAYTSEKHQLGGVLVIADPEGSPTPSSRYHAQSIVCTE